MVDPVLRHLLRLTTVNGLARWKSPKRFLGMDWLRFTLCMCMPISSCVHLDSIVVKVVHTARLYRFFPATTFIVLATTVSMLNTTGNGVILALSVYGNRGKESNFRWLEGETQGDWQLKIKRKKSVLSGPGHELKLWTLFQQIRMAKGSLGLNVQKTFRKDGSWQEELVLVLTWISSHAFWLTNDPGPVAVKIYSPPDRCKSPTHACPPVWLLASQVLLQI